ncbi:hypothetical protein D3C73_743910 [compost metagenome]
MLEAWDIELVFRRLRQRLNGTAVLLLLTAFFLVPGTPDAWAEETATSPDSPRLLNQPLTSQASRDSIRAILDQPPFKNRETVTRYRFGEDKPAAETPDDGHTPAWLKLLKKWLNSQHLGTLASVIEVLLWSLIIGAIVWLAWRYRDWLQAFVSRRAKLPDLKASRASPQQAFGLDLDRETLPADIATSAENLWQSNPREALGLLYRALLSHLLHEYHLALTPADTEGQVLTRIERLQRPELLVFSQNLTRHWQNMAYGHRLPAPSVQQELCEGWRRIFGAGAQP